MAINIKKDFGASRALSGRKPDITSLVYGKVPPQVPDLEEAVLGAIMLEKDTFATVLEIIRSEGCFYVDAHQKIYGAMRRLFDKGTPVDLLTITEELRETNDLELIGGAYYITRLTMSVLSSAHVEAHARLVMEKFIQRELIRISGSVISEAYEDSTDVFDLIDRAESEIYGISSGNLQKNYVKSTVLAMKAMERIQFLRNNPSSLTGVDTGYRPINNLTCGWQNTDLIILAARPSVGKTAFSINLALNAAMSKIKQTGVGIFSLEMSAGQITNRAICSISKVPYENITRGKLSDSETIAFNKAAALFSELPIVIDDTAGINIFELRAKARRMKDKDGIGLILIDYLQLMSGLDNGKYTNREQEISKISRDLKSLAKELEVPIIALSQLNRSLEGRAKKEPQLSDLRESGAIEQDADVVIFLSRPDYQKKEDEVDLAIKDDATASFQKHRNGSTESISLKFKKDIQTWFDLDSYAAYMYPPSAIKHMDNSKTKIQAESKIEFPIVEQPASDSIDDLPF